MAPDKPPKKKPGEAPHQPGETKSEDATTVMQQLTRVNHPEREPTELRKVVERGRHCIHP